MVPRIGTNVSSITADLRFGMTLTPASMILRARKACVAENKRNETDSTNFELLRPAWPSLCTLLLSDFRLCSVVHFFKVEVYFGVILREHDLLNFVEKFIFQGLICTIGTYYLESSQSSRLDHLLIVPNFVSS